MGHQRALGVACRAQGVDDERGIGRPSGPKPVLQASSDRAAPGMHSSHRNSAAWMVVCEHRIPVDDEMMRKLGRTSAIGRNLVDVFLVARNEERSRAIAHLIFDFSRGGGRVNAIGDRAERLRRKIADHPLFADVAHDRDAMAAFDAERLQQARGTRDEQGVIAPPAFAVDAERFGGESNKIRNCTRALAQKMRRGRLCAGLPGRQSLGRSCGAVFPSRVFFRTNSIAQSNRESTRPSSGAAGPALPVILVQYNA